MPLEPVRIRRPRPNRSDGLAIRLAAVVVLLARFNEGTTLAQIPPDRAGWLRPSPSNEYSAYQRAGPGAATGWLPASAPHAVAPPMQAAPPGAPSHPQSGPLYIASRASDRATTPLLSYPALTVMESAPTPLPPVEHIPAPPADVIDDSACCKPLPSCDSGCSGLARWIWHPPAMGCGQFGCQRLWQDPNLDPEGFTLAGLARGYFLADERVQWSGLEATFGAEAALNPRYVYRTGDWLARADGIFFFNQPFEPNILVDENRASYVENFYHDTFQVWQLNIGITHGDFTVVVGKDRTPFGRYYFPIYSNSHFDAPFVHTEVIKWVETGLFLRFAPGPINLEVAVTNGGIDRDTNSSKALACRAGIDTPCWAFGASAKLQDGTGSEAQKLNNSYYGFDAMARWRRFELSSEAVWDEYGFRNAYNPDDIFWGRSIYYREVFSGEVDGSLHGFGYYVNLAYIHGRFRLDANYGEYYPDQIGNPFQDTNNARLLLQGSLAIMPCVQAFACFMSENDRPREAWRYGQGTDVIYTGLQWVF